MDYLPIEDHGIIGDLYTTALVGIDGTIDYMCFPDFDSPTIFASLLDKDKGGYFKIYPLLHEMTPSQMYLPDTNVLITKFMAEEGIGEIIDLMPVEKKEQAHNLVRRVRSIRGNLKFKLECKPRFNYGLSKHHAELKKNDVTFYSEGEDKLVVKLKSDIPLKINDNDAFSEFTLREGDHTDFILEQIKEGKPVIEDTGEFVQEIIDNTIKVWQAWSEKSNYKGRWREMVRRSVLLLKLLTSRKHGSLIAAPTFGLPERFDGTHNWDYRYTWIRDSSFTVYALMKMGYVEEAGEFIQWVEKQCDDIGEAGNLHLIYRLDGSHVPEERELKHFEGYKKTKPVLTGNGARNQIQLDIYGELMDAVFLFDKHGNSTIYHDFWLDITQQINWVCEHWEDPDHSIWELRQEKKKYLYSRIMCWVAVDRALRLAVKRSFPHPELWKKVRDEIYNSVFENYWDEELRSFVQFIGAKSVDASMLLMPIVKFISPKDPKWLSTLKFIEKELVIDSLVLRYKAGKDGAEKKDSQNTFSVCSFWYIECLSRAGQVEKARLAFQKIIGFCNHLGLYAEQLSLQGRHMGNFPQALTHLGLIGAAYHLNKNLDAELNRKT
jgi:GH15 family glucan-1,4-alpha-glucosidase